MVYKVSIKKNAIKALQVIPDPYFSKIKSAIYSLATNPRPSGFKKLKGRDGYRIRVANYRIIYEIVDDMLFVEVIDIGHIGHRKDIYG